MLGRGGARGKSSRCALALAAAVVLLATGAGVAEAKLFGVVPSGPFPHARELDKMRSGGIARIRLMLHWASVERERGGYDWSTPDAMIRAGTRHGIEPVLFLYGTPNWAAHQDGRSCARKDCSIYPPSSPATREAFAEFAAAAVERYGPHGDFWKPPAGGRRPCGCAVAHPIAAWQIWNEQNSRKYFAPRVNVRRYARMLTGAGAAIEAADPGAEVILGGMWGPSSAKRDVMPVRQYLRRLYAIPGIESSFDSIALHPYAPTAGRSLAAVKAARETVRLAGDRGAGTWITEIGWASGGPPDNPYTKGREGQARLLARLMSELRHRRRTLRLEGVFWYSWRDTAGAKTVCEWCGHAGLRARNGSAKPAWRAFAKVARP